MGEGGGMGKRKVIMTEIVAINVVPICRCVNIVYRIFLERKWSSTDHLQLKSINEISEILCKNAIDLVSFALITFIKLSRLHHLNSHHFIFIILLLQKVANREDIKSKRLETL